jgi:dihydrofolate reductase
MIKMIAGVSLNGIIGVDNKLPWNVPEDMKFFRKMTKDSIVIMGRKTFETINRPLPNRRNIVISRLANGLGVLNADGIEVYSSVKEAIEKCADDTRDIWIIGGEKIYEAGLELANEIYITVIPQWVDTDWKDYARFPFISPALFKAESDDWFEQLGNGVNVIRYVRL